MLKESQGVIKLGGKARVLLDKLSFTVFLQTAVQC